MALGFDQAREWVLSEVRPKEAIVIEEVSLLDAPGRVLAEDILADRDYPPFPRSARDGFALRSADVPGELRVIGEARAGGSFDGSVGHGETVEIMTGAPLPHGADAIVMIEHVERTGDVIRVARGAEPGSNFTPRGLEGQVGQEVLTRGRRIDYTHIAAAAMVGMQTMMVCRRPRVAILPTGDEIVEPGTTPGAFEIRNSNAMSLAAQVRRAGGEPLILPIARDHRESTRAMIEKGLEADLLLLSGGVSAGKYDIVEKVLSELGAEFFFDRVLIQPGQPLVFGRAQGTHFFGLPGNPSSTMVTFELFARAAVDLLSGCKEAPLPLLRSRLTQPLRHKMGITRFLPAQLSLDGSAVKPEPWHGSGDIPSLARANAFLVAEADREEWAEGDDIRVMSK